MVGIDYTDDPRSVLCHFNKKHDKLGRFAKKTGSVSPPTDEKGNRRTIGGVAPRNTGKLNDISSVSETINEKSKYSTHVNPMASGGKEDVRDTISRYEYSNRQVTGSAKVKLRLAAPRNAEEAQAYYSKQIARQGGSDAYKEAEEEKKRQEKINRQKAYEEASQKRNTTNKAMVKRSLTERFVSKVDNFNDTVKDRLKKIGKAFVSNLFNINKKPTGGDHMPLNHSDVLAHANPYHDPKTGQFTTASIGVGMGKYVHNGKLTAEGRRRLEVELKRNARKKKDDQVKAKDGMTVEQILTDPHKWVSEDLSNLETSLNSTSRMTSQVSDFLRKSEAKKPAKRRKNLKLDKMTDSELKSAIDRYMLEQKYLDIFDPKEPPPVKKGKKFVMEALEIGGGVVAVGATAVTIAKAIHEMKKE